MTVSDPSTTPPQETLCDCGATTFPSHPPPQISSLSSPFSAKHPPSLSDYVSSSHTPSCVAAADTVSVGSDSLSSLPPSPSSTPASPDMEDMEDMEDMDMGLTLSSPRLVPPSRIGADAASGRVLLLTPSSICDACPSCPDVCGAEDCAECEEKGRRMRKYEEEKGKMKR